MLTSPQTLKKFLLISIATFLLLGADFATANIGKVLLVIGDVSIQRSEMLKASRGTELLEGDTIVTGANGRAQLLMLDGARIAIKPSTTLSLEKYAYQSEQAEDITGTTQSSMTMSVIKGGFRTITGAISKGEDKSGYQVKTPVATIGIRGTDYEILFTASGTSGQGSLAAGVWDGTISLTNAAGTIDVGDQGTFRFAIVAGANVSPAGQNTPPDGIGTEGTTQDVQPDSNEQPEIVAANDEATDLVPITGGDDEDGHNFDNGELPEVEQTVFNSVAAAGEFDGGFSGSFSSSSDFTSFSENTLTAFQAVSEQATFVANGVEHFNLGFDPESQIAWGRWTGGSVDLLLPNGQLIDSIDLSTQSLHWAFDTVSESAAMPVSGLASYQLIGNTDPTNNLGQVGFLGNATLGVNFTTNVVNSSLALAMGENVWNASGTGQITGGTALFAGNYSDVFINGQSGGSGEFSGFFSSTMNSAGLPAGAGLAYFLTDNASIAEIISGTAIFGNGTHDSP